MLANFTSFMFLPILKLPLPAFKYRAVSYRVEAIKESTIYLNVDLATLKVLQTFIAFIANLLQLTRVLSYALNEPVDKKVP